MFDAGALTFQEFMMREKLPLATIQNAILEFLRGRDDAVVFGAQAVNAYVKEPRMTQDLDLLSFRAAELAQELGEYLSSRFHMAVRVREVASSSANRASAGSGAGRIDCPQADCLPSTAWSTEVRHRLA